MCGSARRCAAHTPYLSHLLHTPHLSSSVAARTYCTLRIETEDCSTSYILHAAHLINILHAAHLLQPLLLLISCTYRCSSSLAATPHSCLQVLILVFPRVCLFSYSFLCMSVSPHAPPCVCGDTRRRRRRWWCAETWRGGCKRRWTACDVCVCAQTRGGAPARGKRPHLTLPRHAGQPQITPLPPPPNLPY